MIERRYADSGPTLRYTNEQGHALEAAARRFHRIYNDDIYDLIKWGAEQRARADVAEAEIVRLNAVEEAAGDLLAVLLPAPRLNEPEWDEPIARLREALVPEEAS